MKYWRQMNIAQNLLSLQTNISARFLFRDLWSDTPGLQQCDIWIIFSSSPCADWMERQSLWSNQDCSCSLCLWALFLPHMTLISGSGNMFLKKRKSNEKSGIAGSDTRIPLWGRVIEHMSDYLFDYLLISDYQKCRKIKGFRLEYTGFEPVASTMRMWRAPNCANTP